MQDLEKKLTDHLRSELIKIRGKDKQITKFVLRHASPGSKGNDVEAWDHDERIEVDDIGVLANEIAGRAQTDADGLGPGVHRYTLQTIIGKNSAGARFMFRLRASEDPDDEIAGEDSPTMKGIVGQLMRHNEAQARTFNAGMSTMFTMMVRRMEAQDERMTKLEHERAETFLALEAAKSEQHSRDLELMEASADQDRKQAGFKKLMELAPVVVNRLSGKEVMPTKADPLAMIIGNLADSLTPEQIQAIAATMSPEQQLMFGEAVRAAKAKQAANAASSNGTH